MMEVQVLARAEVELLERYVWLENQSEGLGAEFDLEVHEAIYMLERHPRIASQYRRTLHRCYTLRRWHFGLFYVIEGGRVFVAAALDLRQDPAAILRRLGSP